MGPGLVSATRRRVTVAARVTSTMGPWWTARRIAYEASRRSGLLARRTPARPWPAVDESASIEWLWGHDAGSLIGDVRRVAAAHDPAAMVDDLARGRVELFGELVDVGHPIRWHRDPLTGSDWPSVHWTRIPDLGPVDVKFTWELGRCGVATRLVRADAAGDDRAGPAYWDLVQSFVDANPLNTGPQWMCGQEASLRLVSLLLAGSWFARRHPSAPGVATLVSLAEGSATRIEANLAYARLQGNNHAVNEALALWLVGVAVPGLARSAGWAGTGRRVLIEELDRQIADDGSYVQQSLRYHRFVLESAAVALALGDRLHRPWPAATVARVRRSAELLAEMVDPVSGRLPNYGSNDGATLLHLHGCDDADARPAVAFALAASRSDRSLGAGPWDELATWFGLRPSPTAEPTPRSEIASPDGGYVTVHGDTSWAFTRAYRQDHRPAQADQLHVDLWWRGVNVVADPGTYRYNAPEPWRNALAATSVHNTVTVDGADQMERGPGFLWLTRAHGRIDDIGPGGTFMHHEGYAHRFVHPIRTVRHLGHDEWEITDHIATVEACDLTWTWLLPECELVSSDGHEAQLTCRAGELSLRVEAHRGSVTLRHHVPTDDDPRGWYSPTYGVRRPATCLTVGGVGIDPAWVTTTIRLGTWRGA